MGFFETLRRVLGKHEDPSAPNVSRAWGLGDEAGPGHDHPAGDPSLYDRMQWHKKLKRILADLPGSRGEWGDLMVEAKALGLDPGWVTMPTSGHTNRLVGQATNMWH